MVFSLQFRGISKPYLKVLKGRKRPTFAPLQRSILTIPGLPGGYLLETTTEVRIIEVPILVKIDFFPDMEKLKEDLAEWLVTEQPEELIFEDEPDRTYYAVVDSSLDLEKILDVGQGTIYFMCPDPYKYGPEKVIEFVESKPFYVEGSVETLPIIKTTIQQDTTFVAVSDGEKLNMIGMPAEVDQQQIIREERKFWDEMGSLTGWSDTTSVEEGKNLGVMGTNGYSFGTTNYGTDLGWHGPAKKKSIGSTIQDFQVDALIIQKGATGQVGSVEIALLDASNNFVAKMLMTKRSTNNQANWARLRAGTAANGYDIINNRGANDLAWANFDGILRIGRIGNTWYAYVSKIDSNGKYHTSMWRQWTDSKNISPDAIAQVQVQLWQYGTVPATTQNIVDIKVFKINSPTDTQVPIIAQAGDVIEFDHQNDIIRRNGEEITKEKAFIGEYFPLKKGLNTLVIEPIDAIENTEVRWKPKWL